MTMKAQMEKVMGDYASTQEVKQKNGGIMTLGSYGKAKVDSMDAKKVSYEYKPVNDARKGLTNG